MIKTRVFPEHNYKGIHMNGKTIRIALDPNKPITELKFPEFYDVACSNTCFGECSYCYVDAKSDGIQIENIVEKFENFFSIMSENEKPFQIAFGGTGEPTTHPMFIPLMIKSHEMGITPNYTTNGMWSFESQENQDAILEVTKNYCGGVAVSTHPHLEKYWRRAVELYLNEGIFTNLHIIIGDNKSVDNFVNIYNEYKGKVKYFVLLPLTAQGRAKEAFVDWDYFQKNIDGSPADIAFGANFFPYLSKDPGRFKVSIYEPEIMSSYLKLEDMKVYKSSFSSEERTIGDEAFQQKLLAI